MEYLWDMGVSSDSERLEGCLRRIEIAQRWWFERREQESGVDDSHLGLFVHFDLRWAKLSVLIWHK